MSSYERLAASYDELTEDVDYQRRADFLERLFQRARLPVHTVLDLACGTGTMTWLLTARGYELIAVDGSEDMLAAAAAKTGPGIPPVFLHQSMPQLDLYGTVDAAICCLDSFNYLTDTKDFARTLAHLHNYIEPGGLLIFDMNAPAKFERVYGENAYVLEEDGILCAWQNFYNEKSKLCDFCLSIFRECHDGRWERLDEAQRERCYSLRTVKKLLVEGGFELCELVGGYGGEKVDKDTERWYFTVRRK